MNHSWNKQTKIFFLKLIPSADNAPKNSVTRCKGGKPKRQNFFKKQRHRKVWHILHARGQRQGLPSVSDLFCCNSKILSITQNEAPKRFENGRSMPKTAANTQVQQHPNFKVRFDLTHTNLQTVFEKKSKITYCIGRNCRNDASFKHSCPV